MALLNTIELLYFSGTAGNSLSGNNDVIFTTRDVDNDSSDKNCANMRHGAWWFKNCGVSHLNGEYLRGIQQRYMGIRWKGFKGTNYSHKFSEMKVGPSDICKTQ